MEFLGAQDIRHISFVILQDMRNICQASAHLCKIFLQISVTLDIFIFHFSLGVCNKNNSVHIFKHRFSDLIVKDLSRNRIKKKAGIKPFHFTYFYGKKIKEQGAMGFGRKGHQFSPMLGLELGINIMDIGSFSA